MIVRVLYNQSGVCWWHLELHSCVFCMMGPFEKHRKGITEVAEEGRGGEEGGEGLFLHLTTSPSHVTELERSRGVSTEPTNTTRGCSSEGDKPQLGPFFLLLHQHFTIRGVSLIH